MQIMKDNIIQFPTTQRLMDVHEERQYETEIKTDDAIEISHYMVAALQGAAANLREDFGVDIDLANKDDSSYKDLRVILNLLVATMYKRFEMDHLFSDELDILDAKLEDYIAIVEDEFNYDFSTTTTSFSIDDLDIDFEPEE